MDYGDKEVCCALLLSQVLDGIASCRLSASLQKALAFRAVELALRRPCAGRMEDEEAARQHVKVPLLPFIDEVVKEELAEVVQFIPLELVENRTAENIVDVHC